MSSTGVILTPIRDDHPALSPPRPHCSSPESILIYLAVPDSNLIPIRVLESDSIASVKIRIQSFKGFVVKNQKLVFDGRELARNDCLIRDYGLTHGNVLHLAIRLADLRGITVETACGKKFVFQVERNRSVGYVKKQIVKKEKSFEFDPDDHKLVFEGEELEDHRTISEICKSNDAIIHLFIRKSAAKVRTRPVEKDFEVSVVATSPKPDVAGDEFQLEYLNRDYSFVEPVIVNPEVDILIVLMDLIRSTSDGLERGFVPVMTTEGSGGAYFMHDASGHNYTGVFKPIDEEPMAGNNPRGLPLSVDGEGLKRGTRVGEGAFREVAAYILDHPINGSKSNRLGDEGMILGFSGVPPTVLVRCLHGEEFKIGSLQMFVRNNGSCEDMGFRVFPVQEVHKIAVLDIRLANADRHAGNVLVCKEGDEGRFRLVPIDHGYCLPENFEDCTFEWLYWPQAREPFNTETISYIETLDAERDISLLKFHGWELPLRCARVLRIGTMLLKKGVQRGLTPYDIGSIMCRETLKKESKIEEILGEAMDCALPCTSEETFLETVSEIMDRYLDRIV